MKKWVVNPITAKRNTLTAFSPSPLKRAGVRLWCEAVGLLAETIWPVCKTYAY